MATVIERVRAGAMLLDSHVVGWAGKIDVKTLSLSNCFGCVLGQTFGPEVLVEESDETGYGIGCRLLNLGDGPWSQAAAFGFHFDAAGMNRETFKILPLLEQFRLIDQWSARQHPALRSAWLTEIALRLGTPEAEEARIEASPVDAGEVWGAL